MIKPINNHVLIEPIKHESFMFSERTTYDEVGVVIEADPAIGHDSNGPLYPLEAGCKVFFDSWLASKFPKGEGSEDYWWLVPYESIKAYEPLPKE